MMTEKRPRNDHETVSHRLDRMMLYRHVSTALREIKPEEITIEPALMRYNPPLRAHEDWRLRREDQYLIYRAQELNLIPESGDCREDLRAALAITDEQWEAAMENNVDYLSDEELSDTY